MAKQPLIKRLFFDVEVSPNIGFFWKSGYKLNISYDNIIKERAIICICYKWENESKVHFLHWNKGDDKKLINDFAKVIIQADEVVGHNGDNFDLKWFRTRCLYHGIKSLPQFKSLDTLKISRKEFNFNSNKLDYIAKFLGFGGKINTDFGLWKEITLNNDAKSLKKMIKYCCKDVILLEKVYKKLELYTTHKTHVGVLGGKGKCTCPNCGSSNTKAHLNKILASGMKRKQLQCKDCGKYFTVSETAFKKEQKIKK